MTPGERYDALAPSVRAIVQHEAVTAGLMPVMLFHHIRSPTYVRARRAVWVRLRELGWSYPEIGRAFGYDHTTVLNALKKPSQTETR